MPAMLPSVRPAIIIAIGLLTLPLASRADVVELESGGRVRGEVSREGSPDRTKVLVNLPGGGRLILARSGVEKTVEHNKLDQTYLRRAAATPDTAEAQKAMALWCRDAKMIPRFRRHMKRVLELDPNDQQARSLLGYQQHGDQWLTREQLMAARGLIRYGSDYRTRQEIELLQRKERGEKSHADWRKRLERWRRDLDSRKQQESQVAVESFQNLTDPAAASALVKLLKSERNPNAQTLLIEAAARIDHAATVQALATLSLKDEDYEVRRRCLEHLVQAKRPGLDEIYVRSLKSKNNVIVNRAGDALRVVASQGTVSPMIEALVTTHEIKIGRDTPKDTYGMSDRGSFQFGGGKAKVRKVDLKNPEVLSALVELTGQNFGFDKLAWNRWLAARIVKEDIDLRRDS